LIVEPGQAAIFVHNGKIEAVQTEPGRWSLETDNIPFITAFKNILRGGESPDKAEVFFVKTTEILNQKW
jgi:membrane protease subunit (stomatin/prohibitin family)